MIVTALDHIMKHTEREQAATMTQRRFDALQRIARSVIEPDETLPVGATVVINIEATDANESADQNCDPSDDDWR